MSLIPKHVHFRCMLPRYHLSKTFFNFDIWTPENNLKYWHQPQGHCRPISIMISATKSGQHKCSRPQNGNYKPSSHHLILPLVSLNTCPSTCWWDTIISISGFSFIWCRYLFYPTTCISLQMQGDGIMYKIHRICRAKIQTKYVILVHVRHIWLRNKDDTKCYVQWSSVNSILLDVINAQSECRSHGMLMFEHQLA